MKLWKRYVTFAILVTLLTLYITLQLYRLIRKYDISDLHSFQRESTDLAEVLSFNSNPDAKFIDVNASPLANDLLTIDRPRARKRVLSKFLKRRAVIDAYQQHGINVGLSDVIPLNRPVADSRPNGCDLITYPKDLPTTSVVIPFHNEWPSILLRTVYSIIQRTPTHLLQEIILVDDSSNLPSLQANFEALVLSSFPGNIVKLHRLRPRSGLIRARLEGLKLVTGDVVSFFDSHMEVNTNWLPPLLAEVKKDRRTVAMAQLDYINRGSMQYTFEAGYKTRYGFDWRLVFFETYFSDQQLQGKRETDPLPGVVMVGPAFVVDVAYFKEIGTYDEDMMIWGGENLEFPWRVWLCGGRLLHVPCSRIGHIARPQPYRFPQGRPQTENHNYKRAVEVWMGEYKKYVYDANPSIQEADEGNLTARLALKERLNCKPFDWFLTNVWPDLLAYETVTLAWGRVKARGMDLCLDNDENLFSTDRQLMARPCTGSVITQMFAMTTENELRTILQCIVVKGALFYDKVPSMHGCHDAPSEKWEHPGPGTLKHERTGLCVTLLHSGSLIMDTCKRGDSRQYWSFQYYNPAHRAHA